MKMIPLAHRRTQKGSVAVEMAYAFPMLILVFMVMLFLMDVIMVKQEVTVSGFSAITQCASANNKGACVMAMVEEGQNIHNSQGRYSCNISNQTNITREGTTFVIINLSCTYEGFTPINAIFQMIGDDMSDVLNFEIPLFFPDVC
jgi:hypothetical protein